MPIDSFALGAPGIVALPGNATLGSFPKFRSPPLAQKNPTITGVTRDSIGNPLGSCLVRCFRTSDNVFMSSTTSDVLGNFTLFATGSGPFYLVAYKAGSTDVAGTTVNTLSAD
jgi:hypothetical protein